MYVHMYTGHGREYFILEKKKTREKYEEYEKMRLFYAKNRVALLFSFKSGFQWFFDKKIRIFQR